MPSPGKTVLAICLAVWAGGGAATAEDTWVALENGSWRLYLGSSPKRPVPLRGLAPGTDLAAPALSPDGSRVAVEVVGRGVTICALDSGECRPPAEVPGLAARPAWNPKTGELVFAMYRFDAASEDSDLWTSGPDLGDPRPLLLQTGNQDDPDISPDGGRLVYRSAQTIALQKTGMRAISHLWSTSLATGEPRLLSAGPYRDLHPVWSPDGKRIAFASDRSGQFEIWVLAVEGGDSRQVTAGDGIKTWPVWSPDGGTLRFTSMRDGRYTLLEVAAGATRADTFTPFAPAAGRQARDADWR